MKIKNKAIKVLAGAVMAVFLSGSVISVPALAETTVAADSSVSDSVLLNDLQCSPVDIDFSPEINTYRIVVPEGTEKVLVSAQLTDPSSIYRVIGNSNLQSGSNTVTVEVEDMDGNKNVYEIQVVVGELNEDETEEATQEETETSETLTEEETASIRSTDSSKGQSMAVISSQSAPTAGSSGVSSQTPSLLDSIKGFLTDPNHFQWILVGIGVIAGFLILLCIILTIRRSKRKRLEKTSSPSQSSGKAAQGSAPVITHDLSWTKGRSYDEDKDDKALSDLLQSLDSDGTDTAKADSEKTPEETTDSKQDNDDDDAFEIVDIDKL